jgi:hypothetical protein
MPEDIDTTSQTDSNFDSDFDYQPLAKSFFQRMEEKMFGLMSGGFLKRKKKTPEPIPEPVQELEEDTDELFEEPARQAHQVRPEIEIVMPEVQRVEKPLSVRIKEKLHFPQISLPKAIVNGLALAVFAAGSYLLYSDLPMHPDLVIGIIMVSVAGNVVIAGR